MRRIPSTDLPAMLDRGRDAFGRRAWGEAYALLSAADGETPLGADDLERAATAGYLTGRDAESAELWARAHQAHLGGSAPERAARCAFWLAFGLLDRGEMARANGWLARARRELEGGRDCVERGYLLLPEAMHRIAEGDSEGAALAFGRAGEIGERFADPDLVTLARHGQGRALLRLGRPAEGVALLDEAMVAVTAGEVSPVVAGDVYCGVISGCQEIFDWRRAREWTAALTRWCAAQPDLVPYRGQCLLRRSEILQLAGDWPDALAEARKACERLAEPPGQEGIGAAFYQRAELHRLRGEHALAEEGYREANRLGRRSQPGLALLHLARGDVGSALAGIRRAVDETAAPRARPGLLAAQAEIALAAGEVTAARAAADELATLAAGLGAPYLRARAAHTAGAVRLAEGDPRSALAPLREAEGIWRSLEAPYEWARTRELIGMACRELGDGTEADLELDAASAVYRRLGAGPDLARTERLRHPAGGARPGGLTAREVQVIRLVAAGMTNRSIAAELRISEKTVARHVSNIFVKLGLSSRAAATAYAYRHALLPPPG